MSRGAEAGEEEAALAHDVATTSSDDEHTKGHVFHFPDGREMDAESQQRLNTDFFRLARECENRCEAQLVSVLTQDKANEACVVHVTAPTAELAKLVEDEFGDQFRVLPIKRFSTGVGITSLKLVGGTMKAPPRQEPDTW